MSSIVLIIMRSGCLEAVMSKGDDGFVEVSVGEIMFNGYPLIETPIECEFEFDDFCCC